MFNFLKKLFGTDDNYEAKYKAALEKFTESDNPYDVRLAFIFAANRNSTLQWDEIDKWMKTEGFEKEKMRDSIVRFEALLK